MVRLRLALMVGSALCVGSCSDLNFGDNPGRDVPKADPALTAFPANLGNGAAVLEASPARR